jgi:LPS export ABC transporter protein LptC
MTIDAIRVSGRTYRVAVFTAAVMAAGAFAGCRDTKQPPVAAGPSVADSADQVLFGVQYLLTSHGIQTGKLLADTAYVLDDQTRFDFRRVHVDFTKETGAPAGTMTADRGSYNLRNQVLEGWGSVVITLVDGRMLKSPHVIYKQTANEISSDTTFEVSGSSGMYHGTGFTADPQFTHFKCDRSCGGQAPVALPDR